MLYEPQRHVALTREPWDEEHARVVIREIVADAEAAYRGEALWPKHPLEEFPGDRYKNLYWGAAGVIWALHRLAKCGATSAVNDWSGAAARLHAAYLAEPDVGASNPVYMIGESGVLRIEQLLAPSASALERLYVALEASLAREADLCFGAPGSLVAANSVYRETKDERWGALVQRHVDRLWSAWSYAPDAGCHLWEIRHPFGTATTHLGGCHGVAGNVMALLQVSDLVPLAKRLELYRRCSEVYERTAVVEDGCANWWRSFGSPGWGANALLVQWCYGAPGMVTALTSFPVADEAGGSAAMDSLLRQAGELTWRAGPLAKGAGLCHGTAGNGFAFLTLYERTREPVWLERARAFAMHAARQVREARSVYGRGRYSLWTGDLGVAIYLEQCIRGVAGIPTLDYV